MPGTTAWKAPRKPLAHGEGPRFFEVSRLAGLETSRQEIIEGLLRPHPQLSPKFFYDALPNPAATSSLEEASALHLPLHPAPRPVLTVDEPPRFPPDLLLKLH